MLVKDRNSSCNHDRTFAFRNPGKLGSDEDSPSSRSSRRSRSLRNGEIPRNSHDRVGGGFFSKEEVASDYEKRIAFIQKQHEKMLTALHREVEQLKRKNKGFMT